VLVKHQLNIGVSKKRQDNLYFDREINIIYNKVAKSISKKVGGEKNKKER